jgi:hypothetical protein
MIPCERTTAGHYQRINSRGQELVTQQVFVACDRSVREVAKLMLIKLY